MWGGTCGEGAWGVVSVGEAWGVDRACGRRGEVLGASLRTGRGFKMNL